MRHAFRVLFGFWRLAAMRHEEVCEGRATSNCFVKMGRERIKMGIASVFSGKKRVWPEIVAGRSGVNACKRQRQRQVKGSAKAEALGARGYEHQPRTW